MKSTLQGAYNRASISLFCSLISVRAHTHHHSIRASAAPVGSQMSRKYPAPLVVQPSETHTATVFILHGLGDSGAGWVDFGPEFAPDLPHTKFVFPTAPKIPVSLNSGMVMNAWYDLYSLDKIDTREDKTNLRLSAEYVSSLVREESKSGIDSKRVVVAGFSQGGALALLSLRNNDLPLAGVLSMSGYLTLADEPLVAEANRQTPLLMCHGDADPVVQYRYGVESHERLKAAGANVTFMTYRRLGHSVAPHEIEAVKEFLKSCLPQ